MMKRSLSNFLLEHIFPFGAAIVFLFVASWVYAEDNLSQIDDVTLNEILPSDEQDAGDASEVKIPEEEEKEQSEEAEPEEDPKPVVEEENIVEDEDYICSGSFRLCYGEFHVGGDRGRFREDQWMNDNSRGGIDWFSVEFFPQEEHDYHVLFEGKAIFDDWYEAYCLANRADGNHYFMTDISSWRHYFDGTTKVATTEEVNDRHIFKDRRTYLTEFGYTPENCPEFIIGWYRLENDGVEPPLRGVSAGAFNGPYDLLGLLHEDGVTDTIYTEVGHTFCDKYNLRLRTEYEHYDDNRHGLFGQSDSFEEDNDIRIWRQFALFDTFLNECTYFSLSYLFYDVKNTTTRDVFRPSGVPRFFEKDVNNTIRAHIGLARLNKQSFLNICHLRFDSRLRMEYSETSLKGDLDNGSFEKTRGSYDVWNFEESAKLTYKGFYRTTLTADVQLQQRFEDKDWFNDHSGPVIRKTDIDDFKQRYILTAVRRLSSCIKGTFRARYRHTLRDYDEREDTTVDDYPGYFGDIRRNIADVMAKTDIRFNSCIFSTLYYQWRYDTYKTDLGGKTRKRKTHRFGGIFSWNPKDCFFVTATGIYDYCRLDTPTDVDPAICEDWKPGKSPYDFRGHNYTIQLDGIYAFNPNTSTHCGYRHTEALGSVDFAGDYSYDQVDFGIKHKISCLGEIALAYRFIHFDDHRKKHDDYDAHGGQICWEHTF